MAALKEVLKRFKFDQAELKKSPVANVSAVPLENNIYEWHCNIRQDEIIFHLILFFPQQYPYQSPSAEFVPNGFVYNSGATKQGKKGTQICLDIFSDFSDYHTEWKTKKGEGWSPAYTVQTILMNVVAFLSETQASGSSSTTYVNNLNLSKSFTCSDCGHCYSSPFPSLDNEVMQGSTPVKKHSKSERTKAKGKEDLSDLPTETEDLFQLIDYISKEKFKIQKPASVQDIWGYGLAVSGTAWRPTLTSPCEFITGRSFYGMEKAAGVVQSVFKEELKLFLPLFIHPVHGSGIQEEFERTLRKVGKLMPKYTDKTPIEDLVLKTIPNLLTATVVEFSKGTQHTSDNSLSGYFALHRLFLWAIDTYPGLQDKIEEQVKSFVENEDDRSKDKVPYIAEWLMLVSGSKKYRWKDVAGAYLSESWKRNVIWYVKDDVKLGLLDTPKEYRIKHTYDLTEIARKHLAFQACFLDVAMPAGMSRKEVLKRYDDNLGFPTREMVEVMKEAFVNINTNLKNYQDWFQILKLSVPSDDELYSIMVRAVQFSIESPGYHWKGGKGGGWVMVLKKYSGMVQEEEAKKKKNQKPGDGTEGEESTSTNSVGEDSNAGGGKTAAAKGASRGKSATRGTSQGRGKSATKGKKRKADSDDDDGGYQGASYEGQGQSRGRSTKRSRK
ncbi:unnamed protein product [Candidula unifasciata]|uniref:UBC core domain-containing protein n=1 Tax=Candidula unifasciata TaxID=100452 RepID=A0A8S3ZQN7_9EUPU|nr:unnamed protein product [Candidula unifasciata]